MRILFKYFGLAALAGAIVLLALNLFFVDLVTIAGPDMFPTLGRDAWLLVNRHGEPRRGDLVMFRAVEGGPWQVRRVVALPGEKISVVDGKPHIGEQVAAQEPVDEVTIENRVYRVLRENLDGRTWSVLDDTIRRLTDMKELDVEDGYFVLADNREHAKDSREYKTIPRTRVRGVVWRILSSGRYP